MTDSELTRKPTKLDHIVRQLPPWRGADDGVTECGRLVRDVAGIATADEIRARVARVGQARAAFTVCMTCVDRVRYSHTWDQDPISVIEHEIKRVGWARPGNYEPRNETDRQRRDERQRFTSELRALAALAAAHRDEFDGYLAGLADTTDLASHRNTRRMTAR